MSKPTEYLMTEKIVAMIETAKPSLYSLRLFHACYAYVDRDPRLNFGIVALTGKPGCTAACSDLAAIAGAPSSKSNAWINEAVNGHDLSSLFSQLVFSDGGRLLTFKFRPSIGQASNRSTKTPFAMVNGDDIATISSAAEAMFYTRAVLVMNANQPIFDLPGIGQQGAPWTDSVKKSWLRIAARVGERLDQSYLMLPQRNALTREIDTVRIKFSTPRSRWSPECLYPRRSSAPISIVHAGEFRSLSKDELHTRKYWTRVLGS